MKHYEKVDGLLACGLPISSLTANELNEVTFLLQNATCPKCRKWIDKKQVIPLSSDPKNANVFLFVGGENDGKRMRVGDMEFMLLPTAPYDGVCDTEMFRREKIPTPDGTFVFFILDSIPSSEAVLRLMRGYQGFRQKDRTS